MIRQANTKDIDQIYSIWKEGRRNYFPEKEILREHSEWKENIQRMLDEQDSTFGFWVYEVHGKVEAWFSIQPCRPNPALNPLFGEISVYVHPDAWNNGLAQDLVKHAIESARQSTICYLCALTPVENAIVNRLTEAVGFHKMGELPHSKKDTFGSAYYYWVKAL